MKNNEEKQSIESIINFKSNVFKAQNYIKENYNVDSEYDEETSTLRLYTENINEALNVATAKEYIGNEIGDLLTVEI